MEQMKTVPTDADVQEFLDAAGPAGRREDGYRLRELMESITGTAPQMWGPSIVGFGSKHYRYATGREGDEPVVAFSPRKASMSLYGLQVPGSDDLLERLGKHKRGVGCIWVGRLNRIDVDVLSELITTAWAHGQHSS